MGTAGRGIPDFEFDRRGDAFERQLQHVPITADEKPGRAALIRLSCGTCCSDEDGRADRPQNQSLSHSLFWYLRRGCIGASLGGGCRCAEMRSASAPCEEPGSPRPGSFAWLRRFRIPFGANPSWRKMRRKPLRPAARAPRSRAVKRRRSLWAQLLDQAGVPPCESAERRACSMCSLRCAVRAGSRIERPRACDCTGVFDWGRRGRKTRDMPQFVKPTHGRGSGSRSTRHAHFDAQWQPSATDLT